MDERPNQVIDILEADILDEHIDANVDEIGIGGLDKDCDTTPPGSYLFPYIVLLPVIAVFIIVSNATLLTILCRTKMAAKRANWHVTSLACADLLLGFYVIIRFFVMTSKDKSIYIYLCYGAFSISAFVNTCSITNILMLVIDRYIFVMRAMEYHKIVTKHVSAAMIVAAWTLSVMAGFLPWIGLKSDAPSDVCIISRWYILIKFICYCIPFVGIIGLYLRICCLLCSKQLRKPMVLVNGTTTYEEDSASTLRAFHHILDNLSMAKPVVIIVACFTLSWMPMMVINLVSVHPSVSCATSTAVARTFVLLRYSNSMINPVLNSWYNQQLRSVTHDYLRDVLTRIQNISK